MKVITYTSNVMSTVTQTTYQTQPKHDRDVLILCLFQLLWKCCWSLVC